MGGQALGFTNTSSSSAVANCRHSGYKVDPIPDTAELGGLGATVRCPDHGLISLGHSLALLPYNFPALPPWVRAGSRGWRGVCRGPGLACVTGAVPLTFFLASDLRKGAVSTYNRCGQLCALARCLFKDTHAQLLGLLLNIWTCFFSALHSFLGWVHRARYSRHGRDRVPLKMSRGPWDGFPRYPVCTVHYHN